jgi:hypothetical protein
MIKSYEILLESGKLRAFSISAICNDKLHGPTVSPPEKGLSGTQWFGGCSPDMDIARTNHCPFSESNRALQYVDLNKDG